MWFVIREAIHHLAFIRYLYVRVCGFRENVQLCFCFHWDVMCLRNYIWVKEVSAIRVHTLIKEWDTGTNILMWRMSNITQDAYDGCIFWTFNSNIRSQKGAGNDVFVFVLSLRKIYAHNIRLKTLRNFITSWVYSASVQSVYSRS